MPKFSKPVQGMIVITVAVLVGLPIFALVGSNEDGFLGLVAYEEPVFGGPESTAEPVPTEEPGEDESDEGIEEDTVEDEGDTEIEESPVPTTVDEVEDGADSESGSEDETPMPIETEEPSETGTGEAVDSSDMDETPEMTETEEPSGDDETESGEMDETPEMAETQEPSDEDADIDGTPEMDETEEPSGGDVESAVMDETPEMTETEEPSGEDSSEDVESAIGDGTPDPEVTDEPAEIVATATAIPTLADVDGEPDSIEPTLTPIAVVVDDEVPEGVAEVATTILEIRTQRGADINIIFQWFMFFNLLLGASFAVRKDFVSHRNIMTFNVLVNWFSIAGRMIPKVDDWIGDPIAPTYSKLAIQIHAVGGVTVMLFASYLVFRMWFEKRLPSWIKIDPIKVWMRLTLVIWLSLILLGTFMYFDIHSN